MKLAIVERLAFGMLKGKCGQLFLVDCVAGSKPEDQFLRWNNNAPRLGWIASQSFLLDAPVSWLADRSSALWKALHNPLLQPFSLSCLYHGVGRSIHYSGMLSGS